MSDRDIAESDAPNSGADARRFPLIGPASLTAAALIALYLLVTQLLAVVPVSWTDPLLQSRWAQQQILALGALRDTMGSWNLVAGLVATALVMCAYRCGGNKRFAGTVAGITGAGLAMTVITGVVLVYTTHQQTGRWVLFSPMAPLTLSRGQPDRTVTYATLDGVPLQADIYLPDSAGPVPLVVSIHGGGFIGGSRGPNQYSRWLADQGYAVFDVDYRLSDGTTQRWNTQEGDIGCAMTWAAAHANEFGWDMGRVATFGGSAGGSLAINIANKVNATTLTPTCGTAGELPRVRAAVGIYPVVDLTAAAGDSAGGDHFSLQHLGGAPDEYPQRYAAIDSAPHLGPQSPPTLLVHGGADHLVFASHTADFADDLAAAGVTHRYVEVPFLDHGYDAVRTAGTELGRSLTLDWLRRHNS